MKIEFEFKEWIARGGFGEVHRAIRKDTGEECAVKVLRNYKDADCRRRFVREVQTLAKQNGSGVIKLIAYEIDTDPPWFAMPLMKGGTLAAHVGKLSHDTVRALVRRFAAVLRDLHARGLLHRDLKPANILLDGDGNATLTDFGLGNDPALMLTVAAVGTPGYMAPELRWGAYSEATDVYALGATTFELLTGINPATVANLDPWQYNKTIPEDLRNLVLHMVQEEAYQRPTTRKILQWLGPVQRPGEARVPLAAPLAKIVAGVAAVGLGFWALTKIFGGGNRS